MLKTGELTSFDGTNLYYEISSVKNPKAAIVIVHGLSEHCGRYHHLYKMLNDNNYTVIGFDNRGNGRSGGKKGENKNFNNFLDDVHVMKKLASKESNKVYLLGHSLGGFIVNAYGIKYNDVDGIISSGAVGVFLKQISIFRFIPYKIFSKINIKNNLANVLSHNEEVERAYLADPYVNKTNKLSLLGSSFITGIRYLRKYIHKLSLPILYLHGKDDLIVPYQSSIYLYENISSSDKKLLIYDEMYHEIFNEVNKEKVFHDVILWLDKHAD